VKAALERATGLRLRPRPRPLAAGGGFAALERWDSDVGAVFVKRAPRARLDPLEAEADGLRELARAAAIRVPRVLAVGATDDQAFLALEWIDLGPACVRSEAQLGAALARQHRCTAPRFGWHRDNTLGATPQRNAWNDDGARFFAGQRC
jgi:protein-ribulosamine 3-kinase